MEVCLNSVTKRILAKTRTRNCTYANLQKISTKIDIQQPCKLSFKLNLNLTALRNEQSANENFFLCAQVRKHDFLVALYISARAVFVNHATANRNVLRIGRQLGYPGHIKIHISTKWFLDMTRKFEPVGMSVWVWTAQKEITSVHLTA